PRPAVDYAVALTVATRRPEEIGLGDVAPFIEFGASPRASLNMVHAARALALLRGREYALPRDVRDLARDVLRHRLVLSYEALAEGIDADTVLDRVLQTVPMPDVELSPAEEAQAA
ncbi:MAG: AAA family ATPase, partial [Baekduiaceae bacterium]